MIKLVASDLDGTLIPEETFTINPEIFDRIRRLKEKGIIFVAASGRQYSSLKNIFMPVLDDIMFIADNGAYVIEHGEILKSSVFKKEIYQEIISWLRPMKGLILMLSTENGDYTNCKDPAFLKYVDENYGLTLNQAEPQDLDVGVSKIAVYSDRETRSRLAREGRERFGDISNILVSSEHWMDFIPQGVDKGIGLTWIQEKLGIAVEETMCFGDQNNDMGMLRCAAESYAVAGAAPEVKALAKHVLDAGPKENAVLRILDQII